MAIDTTMWLYNLTQRNTSGIHPLELWSCLSFLPTKIILSNTHTCRFTTYVLEQKLQKGLRIYHIKVHTVYYDTRDLFSSTKLKIYNKEKLYRVKVIILYKYRI